MKILDYKRKRIGEDGEEYVDLIGRSFEPKDGTIIKNFKVVTENEEMRADKLSEIGFGSNRFSDIVMKFNGIESVFNIQEGDIILFPELQYVEQSLIKTTEPKKKATFNELIEKANSTTSKVPTIDKNRIARLEKLAQKYKNPAKNIQNPNLLNEGERNIEKKDGLLFFK